MPKINLLMGDPDLMYLKAVEAYLMEHYAHRFHVYSYSVPELLQKKLAEHGDRIQLLLIHPQLLTAEILSQYEERIVLLSEGELKLEFSHLPTLYKYQRGDKIAAEIIQNLAGKKIAVVKEDGKQAQTQLILVYSWEGGIGKTVTTVALANQLARMGKHVLYLNFETYATTSLYFDCAVSEKMAQLFYYMKGKDPQLLLKMEGIRLKDPNSGISYFAPADQASDFNEITESELTYFIQALQKSGEYDHILIDTDTQWNERVDLLFRLSDLILLLQSETPSCLEKKQQFLKILENENHREINLLDKTKFCFNQHRDRIVPLQETFQSDYRLPFEPSLLIPKGSRYEMNQESEFMKLVLEMAASMIAANSEVKDGESAYSSNH